jgi:VWFA-related protein
MTAMVTAQIRPPETSSAQPAQSSVQLLISISDKHGRAVSVSKSDLNVRADKRPVEIQDLASAKDVALKFVVLVDLSGSNGDKIEFEKKAAAQIFEALSTGSNEGYFGWFNQEVHISTHPMQVAEVNQLLSRAKTGGATALYNAVAGACQQRLGHVGNTPPLRRVVFVITDGKDNQSQVSASDVAKLAQQEGVLVFAVGLSSYKAPEGDRVLTKLAEETGGNAVILEGPGKFLDRLLQPLDTQYFLTFNSPAVPDGKTHALQVKAADHNIKIQAPFGYGTE